MKISASILICLSVMWGCSDSGPAPHPNTPQWVNSLIVQFQNAPPGNPPQSIWTYQYKGRTVYYVPPQCCDQFSTLYDTNGNILCAPDGGLTGRGDGKCPDFFQERKNGVLIWRDPRGK